MTSPSFASARTAGIATVVGFPRTARGLATAGTTAMASLMLLLPIGAVLQIVLGAQMDDRTPTQAIVVLDPSRYWGNAGPALGARLDHAAELYREGVAPVVIITGPRRDTARQQAVLVAKGVPSQDVATFPTGGDTVGTFQVLATVMNDLGWSSATVVTDPAHAARAEATASALGIDAHMSPADAGPGSALTSEYVGRESLALMRFYVQTRWSLNPVVH
ncbi:MAG: hypothetical protein GC156_03205 [Actinomycetales bacterium]|nr:hypothetical protein [Actinomycetales bacterium]